MKTSQVIYSLRQLFTRSKTFIIMVLLLATLGACKKQYPSYPYAELLSFSIKDAKGAPLLGAVQGNEIVIYWPPEQVVPERINPQLTVSERAVVSPASNASVPFVSGTSFTVTAQDGTTKVYKLKTVLNQAKPYVKDDGDNYGLDTRNSKLSIVESQTLAFMGNYFNPIEGQLKVFLQAADGKEVEIPIDRERFERNLVRLEAIPGTNAVGKYVGIRIQSNPYSINIKKDFEVKADPRPNHTPLTTAQTVKLGGEFTLLGKNMDKANEVRLWNKNLNGYYTVEIIEKQPGKIRFKIPATGFPTGPYITAFYTFDQNPDYPDLFNAIQGINRPLGADLNVTE